MTNMYDLKHPRVFAPIVLDPTSAQRELALLETSGEPSAAPLVQNVRDLILAESLTPLQAQAVLISAWAEIQAAGVIVPGEKLSYHQS